MPSPSSRELDIVLYGATGFVGALTAAHVARRASATGGPGRLRVALAGRSATRLEALRSQLAATTPTVSGWEVVAVDATDRDGLRALAARTRVLVTTVGPYDAYGREVARACAEEGTHYADLTGELLFVRWSMDELDARARETGAALVHASGFDSVPSDLGVLLTAQQAARDGEGTLTDATLRVRSMKGGFSGGTVDSARKQAVAAREDAALRRVLADPYALSPRRADEPSRGGSRRRGIVARVRGLVPADRDPETGRWSGPFVMAGFNTRVVRLSNTLSDWSYGRGLRYREVVDFGRGALAPVLATATGLGLAAGLAGLSFGPTRAVLDRFLPRPGEGPSAEQRAAGRFRLDVEARTTTGARYRTRVAAPFDPGYGGTAVMLGETALALADDAGLPLRAGVVTPATALGGRLAERLREQGFTLEVERLDVPEADPADSAEPLAHG